MASQAFTRSQLVLPMINTARITARQTCRPSPQRRALGRLPQGMEANNPLEDPREDLGGPGGQELYPVSMALHKRFASITAAWVVAACGVMYLAKRIEWAPRDPDVVHVLIHDNTKGELDDVKRIPVRVRPEDVRRPH
ncbi:hypothetical protein QBC47DRAFT_361874 [Echria macrotheca]|uniref:Uncharacterized protein n=1 Tax=Echria macrotheca TaxID=438768 RepID=A0AAJ0BAQ9_9PEZI|nr:hypothetical protein QBC47DRAFT_361874 [Echria macrotheca]